MNQFWDIEKSIKEVWTVTKIDRSLPGLRQNPTEFTDIDDAMVFLLRAELDILCEKTNSVRWKIGHPFKISEVDEMQEYAYEIGERIKRYVCEREGRI